MKFQILLHLHPSSIGRRSPAPSGFRCDWRLSFQQSNLNCGQITIWEQPEICPGETREAILEPLVQDLWKDVQPGQQLGMHEGPKQIGVAKVLEVL